MDYNATALQAVYKPDSAHRTNGATSVATEHQPDLKGKEQSQTTAATSSCTAGEGDATGVHMGNRGIDEPAPGEDPKVEDDSEIKNTEAASNANLLHAAQQCSDNFYQSADNKKALLNLKNLSINKEGQVSTNQ